MTSEQLKSARSRPLCSTERYAPAGWHCRSLISRIASYSHTCNSCEEACDAYEKSPRKVKYGKLLAPCRVHDSSPRIDHT